MENIMEAKTKPAEKIDTTPKAMEAGGQAVTNTAGKPIPEPISQASLATPVPNKKAEFNEKLANLLKECGYNLTDTNSVAGKLVADIEGEERKQTRSLLLAQKEEDTKKLLAVHGELLAAIAPIIEKAGIKMDIRGKQIVYHVGDAGSPCFDLAYPEPLPDGTKKPSKNGGIKVRKAVVMGAVMLRIPELSKNEKAAESLSAFYKFWTKNENHGFASATVAVQNIGDGSEGKSGQDGVFKVQNVPAVPETVNATGQKAYNIVTLTPKGYKLFNITQGKVAKAAPAPVAAPVVAEAPKPTPVPVVAPVVAETPKVETSVVTATETVKLTKAQRRALRNPS